MTKHQYDYFDNDQNHKLQWLSLFIQSRLAESNEINEDNLFCMANSAWFYKTKGTLSKTEFTPVLNLILRYNLAFKMISNVQRLKLASSEMREAAIAILNTPIKLKKK